VFPPVLFFIPCFPFLLIITLPRTHLPLTSTPKNQNQPQPRHPPRSTNRHASKELVQLSLVACCLGCGWLCGRLELSEELGAFVAGAMVASAERSLVARGLLIPSKSLTATMTSPTPDHPISPRAAAAAAAPPGQCAPGAAPMCASIDAVANVLTALFAASIGLIMSPVFLWHHATVLLAGTVVVMAVKAAVVATVAQMFGVCSRVAWAAGLTMAHTGEFSFVLLSMAHQLELLPETVGGWGAVLGLCWDCVGMVSVSVWVRRGGLWGGTGFVLMSCVAPEQFLTNCSLSLTLTTPPQPQPLPLQLYMLLLGITALSLLTTPLVILVTNSLLPNTSSLGGSSMSHHHHHHPNHPSPFAFYSARQLLKGRLGGGGKSVDGQMGDLAQVLEVGVGRFQGLGWFPSGVLVWR